MTAMHTRVVMVIMITLFAATGRMLHIDAQNLWVDEGFTYYTTKLPDILPILRIDVHPPLYFLMMNGWAKVAGTSELALRYISALAGILNIAVIYQLGRELIWRRGGNPDTSWLPLIAALLLALADIELDLAKEARMYTLHTLLAAVCVLAYLRWWRQPNRYDAILIVLSSAVLVYINYLGVWTPLVIGLHALIFQSGRRKFEAIGLLILAALAFLPWLLLIGLHQVGNGVGAERADASTFETLLAYRNNWFGPGWTLTLGLALLGIFTLTECFTARLKSYSIPVLLLMWAILPLAATFIANNWFPVLAAHRVSQITPAIMLLIAFGFTHFRQSTQAFLLAVIVSANLASVDFYRVKGPWLAYAETITPFFTKNDLVLVEIGGGDYMMEYYFDRLLPEGDVRLLKRWREFTPTDYDANLAPLVDEQSTVWLLQWSSNTQALDLLVRQGFVPTMHRITPHINSQLESYRFDRLSDEPLAAFENDMTLISARFRPKALELDLWWTTAHPLAADFTTSGFMLNEAGVLVAQWDSSPMLNERPTTTWQPGEVIYDPKPLESVGIDSLPSGQYMIGVVVYLWSPDAVTRILTSDGRDSIVVDEYTLSP